MQPRRPGAIGPIEKARDSRHALTRLLSYLRPYRARIFLVFGCIILSTLFGLVGPYLMGIAIDRYIAVNLVAGLPRIALWMLAAYLLNNIFQAIADWIMAQISQRSLNRLRRDLFSHMQGLPLMFFDTRPAGELMSRLTNDMMRSIRRCRKISRRFWRVS